MAISDHEYKVNDFYGYISVKVNKVNRNYKMSYN